MLELYMVKYTEDGIENKPTFRNLSNALRMAQSLAKKGLEVDVVDMSQVETRGL